MRWFRVVLSLGLAAGCTTEVLHDLDEASANAAVTALEGAGITADKRIGDGAGSAPRFALEVPSREVVRALDVLGQRGLPRPARAGFAEIYARPALIPSALEERARFILATTGEVERTLESIDGVLDARVHLVPEEADPNALDGRIRSPARAAILLRVRPGARVLGTADIQRLVAGSVPGLDAAAVAVVATPAVSGPSAAAAAPGEPGPGERLARLGPFQVAHDSRTPLAVVAGLALLCIGTLAVLLLVTLRRRTAA